MGHGGGGAGRWRDSRRVAAVTAPVARRWHEGKTPAQVVHFLDGADKPSLRRMVPARRRSVCGEVVGRFSTARADVTCMACLRASDGEAT